jgi:hypothetical protein
LWPIEVVYWWASEAKCGVLNWVVLICNGKFEGLSVLTTNIQGRTMKGKRKEEGRSEGEEGPRITHVMP